MRRIVIALEHDADEIWLPVRVGLSSNETLVNHYDDIESQPSIVVRALLDTGASRTYVAQALATKLGVTRCADTCAVTPWGIVTSPVYRMAMTIPADGGLHFDGIMVAAHSGRDAAPVLIGMDVIRFFVVVIDGPRQTITIEWPDAGQ